MLSGVETVVGYGTYIQLIESLINGKEIISTGMTKEVDRVGAAIDAAAAGRSVALVSSGDPGIYAMAGLVFEICSARRLVVRKASAFKTVGVASSTASGMMLEMVPGIPALCAGAALLGAPLMQDFAAISLSDLLTPWELIEKRLHAAAGADFVMVIYNPKSKKRHWQLEKARQIAMAYRSGQTPVGIVTGAMREGGRMAVTTLDRLPEAEVDMQTTVFIGCSTTQTYGDFMFTMRGYGKKYTL